jgi:hypothetical protein
MKMAITQPLLLIQMAIILNQLAYFPFERMFNKLKHWRGVATPYDKTATSFLAFIHLASTLIWTS